MKPLVACCPPATAQSGLCPACAHLATQVAPPLNVLMLSLSHSCLTPGLMARLAEGLAAAPDVKTVCLYVYHAFDSQVRCFGLLPLHLPSVLSLCRCTCPRSFPLALLLPSDLSFTFAPALALLSWRSSHPNAHPTTPPRPASPALYMQDGGRGDGTLLLGSPQPSVPLIPPPGGASAGANRSSVDGGHPAPASGPAQLWASLLCSLPPSVLHLQLFGCSDRALRALVRGAAAAPPLARALRLTVIVDDYAPGLGAEWVEAKGLCARREPPLWLEIVRWG